jgi:class 3 adenylate cyclase/tetratricopeptide (TPR) repeat protein
VPQRGDGAGFGQHRLSETIAAPIAYTPEHIRARIVAGRGELEGQRKFVTVLFADIRGSTALIEAMDSEDALERLDPVVQRMIEAVHRHEGLVARVQGDGIMALFGAPLAREDHAIQACKAALAMQDSVEALGDPLLKIRIGLHAGPVVVRSIAHDLSMHYDAAGIPVHIAARMEQLAEVGEIRITEQVRELVEGHVEVTPVGRVAVKGLSQPVDVFALRAPKPGRSRWHVRKARGLTAFAGRARELRRLHEMRRAAAAGAGQAAAITGLPGIGKSRLIHEFLAGVEDGTLVFEAHGQPDGRNEPYLAVGSALRAWLGIAERDGGEEVGGLVEAWIARLGEPLTAFAPAYRFLLGVPAGDAGWQRLDPADRKEQLHRAIAALLRESARERPVVLVIEDLHWIDPETEQALAFAIPQLAATRTMLLLSSRPDYRHRWAGIALEEFALGPLSSEEEGVLLDRLLGEGASRPELKTAISERAQGNPLYAEEILRALAAGGAVRREGGAFVLARELAEIEIPATVQAVIASRIDALPSETRTLLETAAVIGQTVPAAILAAVAGKDRAAAGALCRVLVERNLLDEAIGAGEVEYAFTHALIRDVCYESILKSRRKVMHAAALDAFEGTLAGRVTEHAGRLAEHAVRAERWDRAVKYGQLAGARAAELSAYGEAVRAFDLAIDALGRVPAGEAKPELAVELRIAQQSSLGAMGRIADMERRLAEAEAICRGTGDRRRLAAVKMYQTFALNYLGRLGEAIAAGTEGLELARSYQDHVLAVAGAYYLAQAYQWSGQYRRVVDLLAPEVHRFKGPLRDRRIGTAGTVSVLWHGLLGAARAYLGDFEKARGDADEAAAIAAQTRRPYDLVLSKWYQGFVRYHGGDAGGALPLLEEAHRLCAEAKIVFLMPVVGTSLGYAKLMLGRHAEAIADLERAVQQSRQTRLAYAIAWSTCHLGEAYLAAGEKEKARAALEEALRIAREHGYRGVEETAGGHGNALTSASHSRNLR